MFCTNCGEESKNDKKFCTNCGTGFLSHQNVKNSTNQSIKTNRHKRIIKILIWVVIIGLIIFFNVQDSADSDAIEKNNIALTAYNSGDNVLAINQLQQASQSATTNDTKITTLINLAYAYLSDSENLLALNTFKEALDLTTINSFDYYLISGEIALLEGKPNSALLSFNKAYQINPNDFQINNALNLFYLDIDDIAPELIDYPKALSYALKAYSVDQSETATENLGLSYFFNDKYDQAISYLLKSDLNKKPYVALWLGASYAGKEDVINAKYYFNLAINGGVEVSQEIIDYMNSN